MVHSKVGDFSCRTIGFISSVLEVEFEIPIGTRYCGRRGLSASPASATGPASRIRSGCCTRPQLSKFSFAVLSYFTLMKLKETITN